MRLVATFLIHESGCRVPGDCDCERQELADVTLPPPPAAIGLRERLDLLRRAALGQVYERVNGPIAD